MDNTSKKYFSFLLLILAFSMPFYVLGWIFPFNGPFGLPLSFLMIFVTFGLALHFKWKESGKTGIKALFTSIFDIKKAKRHSLVFCIFCMPVVSTLAFIAQKHFEIAIPNDISIPFSEIPLMALLYFLGAIPEEFAWTAVLTEPLSKKHGPAAAGAVIGLVWGIWHVIPWCIMSYALWWICGMMLLNVSMRISMAYTYYYGGKSLFTSLLFHMMINVCMGIFPNYGSGFNPWFFFIWMTLILIVQITKSKSLSNNSNRKEFRSSSFK